MSTEDQRLHYLCEMYARVYEAAARMTEPQKFGGSVAREAAKDAVETILAALPRIPTEPGREKEGGHE